MLEEPFPRETVFLGFPIPRETAFPDPQETTPMALICGGRLFFFRKDEPWLWQSDAIAELRGASQVRLPDRRTVSVMQETEDVVSVPRLLGEQVARGRGPFAVMYENVSTVGDDTDLVFRDRSDLRKDTSISPQHLEAQHLAAANMARAGNGFLTAGCGAGKTVIGVELATLLRKRTVVLVNTEHLMHQWRDRLAQFTHLKEEDLWFVQGGDSAARDNGAPVAVAMVQTLNHLPDDHPIFRAFGVVIVDEAHEAPADCFYKTLLNFTAKHLFAMTATPDRTDRLWYLVPWVVGPCVASIGSTEVPTLRVVYTETVENPTWYGTYLRDAAGNVVSLRDRLGRPVLNADGSTKGVVDPVAYRRGGGKPAFWPYLVNRLTRDGKRQDLLAVEIIRALGQERNVILLSDRKVQLDDLMARLKVLSCLPMPGVNPRVLEIPFSRFGIITADTPMPVRKRMGETCRVLLATMGCLKEGADFPRFDTLIYGTPLSSHVTAVQTAGRVLSRNNPYKELPLVVLPFDKGVLSAARCATKFYRATQQMGWTPEEK